MTDDSPDTRADTNVDVDTDAVSVPGAGAGDAAHTAQIPRIERPVKDQAPAAPPESKTDGKSEVKAETDKGRPRPAPVKATPAKSAPAKSAPAKKTTPSAQSRSPKAGPGPTGRPLSAADYARTTSGSPSTTSVMPAVKDEPAPSKQAPAAPAKTAPAKKPAFKTEPVREADTGSGAGRAATLRLSYVEPWSVARMAFAISVALMIVGVVATMIFWLVLEVTGVWGQIDDSVTSVLSDDSTTFQITDYLGFGRLVGLSLVISALNVVLFTVIATIGAHLYNLAAQLLGGLHLTFTSHD